MKQYDKVNNILGWTVFAIAAFTYCSTIEPTASFWDCPEFILSAHKLEVGHPPGAPFFMITANLFSLFASSPSDVAMMVNIMSALMSAACIMFLFWTITHLARKLVCGEKQVCSSNGGIFTDRPAACATVGTCTGNSGRKPVSTRQMIVIMGSGITGSLAYTWSDTFWFSAVEGEVYAYSSLFTAAVFWLILKWENRADQPHSDRWLILISYLTGLSVGVHLLNLLCIPAIVLVYHYRRNPKAGLRSSLLALLLSAVIIASVLYGIVPGIVKVSGWFELLFVNGMELPFNSGLYAYVITLICVMIWSVYESYTAGSRRLMYISFLATVALLGIPFYGHGMQSVITGILLLSAAAVYLFKVTDTRFIPSARAINTIVLSLMMMVAGYSSYALIMIRSSANTPMDQNSPEDIFTLGEYLGREQYGTRPLFYGKTYASQPALKHVDDGCVYETEEGSPVLRRKEKSAPEEKDRYEEAYTRREYRYAQNMLFPRMHSDDANHVKFYESWMGGIEGRQVPYDRCGETVMLKVPTQWENIRFFLSYQVNFMYWRYFMWNFAGRQNDIQGHGEIEHGNWITGIPLIDDMLVGNVSLMPDSLKNNKGHNVFYCLPLLLGIMGLLWQSQKGNGGIRQFWIVFFLFFMTGLAIVIYLNQTPLQPRERDYAYAGSFYAYAVWIGLGVAAMTEILGRWMKGMAAALTALVIGILVPLQMVSQTWDDHDRSGRYTCRDFGQNYLCSMQEEGNPIIFTFGDNETFPLWYNQEVEGFRTDTRISNLSYLQTDWYIDQMKRPAYDSPSLPISWKRSEYIAGTREAVMVRPELMKEIEKYYSQYPEDAAREFGDNPYELRNILQHWVRSPEEGLQVIPTDSIVIKVDNEAVKRSGMLLPDTIPDYMHISLKGRRAVYKNELMLLEMLANANWERPLYMASTMGPDSYFNLTRNFIQEGLAYRITPFDSTKTGVSIDSEKMYLNLMERFKFGGVNNPDIYLDEATERMCHTHRRLFIQLSSQLIKEGKADKALKALDYCEEMIPSSTVKHDYYYSQSGTMAENYITLGRNDKAEEILTMMANDNAQYITWYLSLDERRFASSYENCLRSLYYLDEICKSLEKIKDDDTGEICGSAIHYTALFNELYSILEDRIGKHSS